MPRLLVLAIAVAIAAAIVVLVVALFVLGAAVRRVDCSPALEPPAALVLTGRRREVAAREDRRADAGK